jgi:hypothetical protein
VAASGSFTNNQANAGNVLGSYQPVKRILVRFSPGMRKVCGAFCAALGNPQSRAESPQKGAFVATGEMEARGK